MDESHNVEQKKLYIYIISYIYVYIYVISCIQSSKTDKLKSHVRNQKTGYFQKRERKY